MTKHLIKIPSKSIDHGQNYINVSKYLYSGEMATFRADKLSFVSEPKSRERLSKQLWQLKSDKLYIVKKYEATKSIAKQYKRCIKINNRKNEYVALTIHYEPNGNKGFIRFELSPQHIKERDMVNLITWLADKNQLGKIIFELLKNAKVTRIDLALDLFGISYLNHYFSLKNASKGKIYNNDNLNGFGGLRLGSYKSYLHFAIYNKIKDNNISNNRNFDMVKISTDIINDNKSRFVRIEARVKPKNLMLYRINQFGCIPNPFERLCIYSRAIKYKLLEHHDFITMLEEFTIPEAMRKIEKSKANKLREILKENQIDLFDVKRLWDEQQLHLMSLLGVLQKPTYWDKNRWNKYVLKLKNR